MALDADVERLAGQLPQRLARGYHSSATARMALERHCDPGHGPS